MAKHALITGVSSGIGAAIANHLLQNGWQITGISRRAPDIKHPHLHWYALDLLDDSAVHNALPQLPRVDAFIHAAGIMAAAPLGTLDSERGHVLWQLHVHSATTLANHLIHTLPADGRILLIGSRTARGMAGRSQYSASKAAMVALARSWAAELAPRGITVNVIAPGATDTPMLRDPTRQQSAPRLPPIGRYIQPQEIAACAAWLLSPDAAAITGQEIVICGGASLT